uniref:ATPase, AAA-type, core, P-loop containing nucleoside triphosphate hydrolase n=1 Tax=Tanacetum cinerariifolium TaxID=118510 RepID=A0A6L2NRG6_TANCI|nr:ATPase, AAA-type, core, P-loop containing nucleoside triphosphate hydrolase [Tanacetum cinerariifolium]
MSVQCITTKSTIPLLRHSDNQIKLKQSRLLSVPLSGFHHNAGSRVLLTTRQNTTRASFQCQCTNKESLADVKTFEGDLGPWKQFVPKLLTQTFNWIEPRNVLFNELIGFDHIIRPFRRYICILQGNSAYKKYNVRLPYGVLLFGAVRIVRIFNEARRRSPSIVFVEDLDIIGGEQRNSESGVDLKQLLYEIDKGYCKKDGRLVLVIAATNRVKSLDEELRDYSHFPKSFHVAKPNEDCRRKMFGLYLEEFILEEDKEAICILVAKSTPGLVWGDLQEIGDESTRLASQSGGHHVTIDDVRRAIKRVNGNLRIDER